jgi:hypothetical protein
MEEQLLCDQWSNGGFAGRQLLDILKSVNFSTMISNFMILGSYFTQA